MISGVLCMVVAAYYGHLTNQHRAPNAPRRLIVVLNSGNAGWFPDQLNEIGLHYRKRALKFMAMAIVCWMLMAAFGAMFELIR